MRRLGTPLFVLLLAGCPVGQRGDRCNPLEYSSNGVQGDCADGLACVYPTAPACGVAYCCATGADGTITDTHPSCQPDPALAGPCVLDLAPAGDGGR